MAAWLFGIRCPQSRVSTDIHAIYSFFVQPGKIKTERSATPQIIEARLGEVLCVFFNPETKQFWTSHKLSHVIVLWSSSGDKDREIRFARLHCLHTRSFV
jgi:hypothetical protein